MYELCVICAARPFQFEKIHCVCVVTKVLVMTADGTVVLAVVERELSR